MINIDSSLFIQIVNFLLTIWVLNILLYKPIRKIVLDRKEKINGLEENIERFSNEAQAKDSAFTSGIREARAKGIKERDALVQQASAEEKKLIQEINEKHQAELSKVKEQITKEAEEARQALQKDIDEFANNISQKILGRAV